MTDTTIRVQVTIEGVNAGNYADNGDFSGQPDNPLNAVISPGLI